MRWTLLLSGLAIGLGSIALMGRQTSAAALPTTVRAHLQDGRFQTVSSIRGLPLGVRDAMQELFGGQLQIAEPGAPFRATDVVLDPTLPPRRLAAAACSMERCVVYYERGGIARTWHVAVFHWTPTQTRFEWGGIAPGGLKTADAVRKAILSGAIKGSSSSW